MKTTLYEVPNEIEDAADNYREQIKRGTCEPTDSWPSSMLFGSLEAAQDEVLSMCDLDLEVDAQNFTWVPDDERGIVWLVINGEKTMPIYVHKNIEVTI